MQAADVWMVKRYDVVNHPQDARISRHPFGLTIGGDHRRHLIVGHPSASTILRQCAKYSGHAP
jgi:hypothetical protein